ncbi:hypothetical protein GGS24DRAFT_67090 [Hypoxylon argillaceum]|nr:hypothetical protein GGS24DRAFT_67090 [Hypoxylon argillaceum]
MSNPLVRRKEEGEERERGGRKTERGKAGDRYTIYIADLQANMPTPFCRAAVVFSMQSWLGESEATTQTTSTPGYFSVGMSVMALLVTYLPIFMPPVPGQAQPAAPTA